MKPGPPLVLVVLDGFGEAEASASNAITLAEPSCYMELRQDYPFALLEASGEGVGLPCGLMGNSEVGHLNIGAGRVVWQDISRIDKKSGNRNICGFTKNLLVELFEILFKGKEITST